MAEKTVLLSAPQEGLGTQHAGVADPYGRSEDDYRACRDEIVLSVDRQLLPYLNEQFGLQVVVVADRPIAVAGLPQELENGDFLEEDRDLEPTRS